MTPPIFLEFDCPGCDEFHSVICDCSADHEETFFCDCVPATCPSCGHRLRNGEPISLDDGESILVDEPTYR